MSKYKIDWCEEKTSSKGTKYFRVTLTDDKNVQYHDVAVFGSFKDYSSIQAGREVDGKLVSKDYQGKPSFTLENEVAEIPRRSPAMITKAMETKAQNIEKAQDNKERGIMTSSTIRMAVDIALAEVTGQPWDGGVFKGLVKEWRTWLISEWDNLEAPPFN